MHFGCTDRNGNFAVLVNDNDDCSISGVCGWDINLITSKVFVSCVCQLNTILVFI